MDMISRETIQPVSFQLVVVGCIHLKLTPDVFVEHIGELQRCRPVSSTCLQKWSCPVHSLSSPPSLSLQGSTPKSI